MLGVEYVDVGGDGDDGDTSGQCGERASLIESRPGNLVDFGDDRGAGFVWSLLLRIAIVLHSGHKVPGEVTFPSLFPTQFS